MSRPCKRNGILAALVAVMAVSVFCSRSSEACIWDTHTLRDELQMYTATFDLITGQFPHHGSAYYENRVSTSRTKLIKNPMDVIARNDLAVALLKLGLFDEALLEFKQIEELEPGRYETASNLGVLFKKRGEYAMAAHSIAKALAIKPEGHLGLGDFYLKMLTWSQAADAGRPETNFLGWPYSEDHRCDDEDECLARVEALIRSDRTFADALLVLGDILRSRGTLNLSLWAYVRAKQLGHPRSDILEQRIAAIFADWRSSAGKSFHNAQVVEDQSETVAVIMRELGEAQSWLLRFEKVEEELIQEGSGTADFKQVEEEMARRGIHRKTAKDVGVRSATLFEKIPWMAVLVTLFLLMSLVFLVRKRMRKSA